MCSWEGFLDPQNEEYVVCYLLSGQGCCPPPAITVISAGLSAAGGHLLLRAGLPCLLPQWWVWRFLTHTGSLPPRKQAHCSHFPSH